MTKVKVAFVGVDHWNRPIFKDVDRKNYYGSTDKLFPYMESESSVLKQVTAEDLLYFGNSFGCEPMGSPCDVEISTTIEQKG